MTTGRPDTVFHAATWEGAEQAQLAQWLRATPAQRLAWLEEMLELARIAGALPESSVSPVSDTTKRD